MDDHAPSVRLLTYVSAAGHRFLADDAWRPEGPNIGRRGEHLTITFLSCDRAVLSERLVRSIGDHLPDFAGELLVVDNGSCPAELRRLRQALERTSLPWRLVELGANLGVAAGRNRTLDHVRTEWVLFLDNDIHLVADPLPRVQVDLATLGCHFLNLPLLDGDGTTTWARGGHLELTVRDGAIHLGSCGVTAREPDRPPPPGEAFLCTLLLGGACVVRSESLRQMGGYDEGLFVGFEDVDLSIRIFRSGMKVGTAAAFALVHDHRRPDSDVDRAYERSRFDAAAIRASATHLERRHGFRVWDATVETWLDTRREALGIRTMDPIPTPMGASSESAAPASMPTVCLVVDREDGPLGDEARRLAAHLSGRYVCTIVPLSVLDDVTQVFTASPPSSVIHFLRAEDLGAVGGAASRSRVDRLGWSWEAFERRFVRSRLVCMGADGDLHPLNPDPEGVRAPSRAGEPP